MFERLGAFLRKPEEYVVVKELPFSGKTVTRVSRGKESFDIDTLGCETVVFDNNGVGCTTELRTETRAEAKGAHEAAVRSVSLVLSAIRQPQGLMSKLLQLVGA